MRIAVLTSSIGVNGLLPIKKFPGVDYHAFIDENVKETSKIEPQNVYALTKYQGETVILKNCTNSLIIRTNFFGWGPVYRSSFSDYIIYNLKQKHIIIYCFRDIFLEF